MLCRWVVEIHFFWSWKSNGKSSLKKSGHPAWGRPGWRPRSYQVFCLPLYQSPVVRHRLQEPRHPTVQCGRKWTGINVGETGLYRVWCVDSCMALQMEGTETAVRPKEPWCQVAVRRSEAEHSWPTAGRDQPARDNYRSVFSNVHYNNNYNLICIAPECQRLQRRWRTESTKKNWERA